MMDQQTENDDFDSGLMGLIDYKSELSKMRMQLSLELAEKEQLESEVSYLKKQLEELKMIHAETVEFATYIENDLVERLDNLGSHHDLKDQPLSDQEKRTATEKTIRWRERVALEVMRNEELNQKIEMLKKELEHVKILYLNTVEHSTLIEDELEERNERLNIISVTDHLTKIYNRLKLHISLKVEMERAKRSQNPLFIIMFDIDHFKQVNDNFGHNVGDKVLIDIVQLVKGIIRQGDVFARWGGEEFIVLVPNTEMEHVSRLIDRIRVEIDGHVFEQAGHVTCSFGLTNFREGDDSSTLLKRVDDALYQSKHEGRNRITIK